jgi:quinol monooxygenase YgiN
MIDRRLVLATAGAIALAASAAFHAPNQAQAQAPTPAPAAPPPDSPWQVTYIEVAPKSAGDAAKLLQAYRNASLKGAGNVQFEAYQRTSPKSHFAIVEQWSDGKAREANNTSAAGKEFRSKLAPMLITAYDERPHYALSVGSKVTTKGAVYAVTHVDIIPPKKDEGVANTKTLADKSRGTPGNLRFDALTQTNRPNHMTIVENWKDKASQEAHTTAAHTKTYRNALTPMSGSLYDERLYTLMK